MLSLDLHVVFRSRAACALEQVRFEQRHGRDDAGLPLERVSVKLQLRADHACAPAHTPRPPNNPLVAALQLGVSTALHRLTLSISCLAGQTSSEQQHGQASIIAEAAGAELASFSAVRQHVR